MALSIEDPEADPLARALAARTGETLTDEFAAIRRRCAALPFADNATEQKILGYDDRGLPR